MVALGGQWKEGGGWWLRLCNSSWLRDDEQINRL